MTYITEGRFTRDYAYMKTLENEATQSKRNES